MYSIRLGKCELINAHTQNDHLHAYVVVTISTCSIYGVTNYGEPSQPML